jgi:acyl-CoA synthetase (NDP forming)
MYSVKDVVESKNVVVFGASRDVLKPGSSLIYSLKDTGFRGNVAGINPQGGEVHGVPLYTKLSDVPFPVDLAVLIIPPAAVVQSLLECARRGVKGAVITAEGFAESGPEGRRYQEQIQDILRSTGMRAFGPNTLGIVNTETGLTTSYAADQLMMKPGSIGFAAQSGIFVGALLRYLSSAGIHVSKGIGLGNKVDVDEAEVLEYLANDEQTRTIGLYLEGIRDGRRFFEVAEKTTRRKPVLLLKGGRTSEGARAIASHTASLAVDDAVLNGALRQAGVLRMQGIEELVGTLIGFDWTGLPKGNRIAIITYSGAQAIMCIDAATEAGLEIARFSGVVHEKLSQFIRTGYKRQNPIDLYPDMMWKGFEATAIGILQTLLEDDGVNGIIFIAFAQMGTDMYLPVLDAIEGKLTKPVFFTLLGSWDDLNASTKLLLSRRIPCVPFPETAVQAMVHMWRHARRVGVAP